MTYKQKHRNKRRARVFLTLAYSTLVLFVAFIVFAIWYGMVHHEPVFHSPVAIAVAMTSLPLLALVFGMISTFNANDRMAYLRSIKEWREKRHFQITVEHLLAGDIRGSLPYYESMPQGKMRDILYGAVVFLGHTLEDQKLADACIERIRILREKSDPSKVEF